MERLWLLELLLLYYFLSFRQSRLEERTEVLQRYPQDASSHTENVAAVALNGSPQPSAVITPGHINSHTSLLAEVPKLNWFRQAKSKNGIKTCFVKLKQLPTEFPFIDLTKAD